MIICLHFSLPLLAVLFSTRLQQLHQPLSAGAFCVYVVIRTHTHTWNQNSEPNLLNICKTGYYPVTQQSVMMLEIILSTEEGIVVIGKFLFDSYRFKSLASKNFLPLNFYLYRAVNLNQQTDKGAIPYWVRGSLDGPLSYMHCPLEGHPVISFAHFQV